MCFDFSLKFLIGLVVLLFVFEPKALGRVSGNCYNALVNSDHFDKNRNIFVNKNQKGRYRPRYTTESASHIVSIAEQRQIKPLQKLPEIVPNLDKFVSYNQGLHFIWLGHSTFLVNFHGKIILFDPVFSKYASPVAFIAKRFQPPIVTLNDLSDIDYIVISHDHYDHLDKPTIEHFVNSNTQFVVPLGVSSHLISWGIDEEKIEQLDWWQEISFGDLRFIAVPSMHFSGRGMYALNRTLWSSWIVQNSSHNIYFSGDSGYSEHFKNIGDMYGPFDLAFVENGQYHINRNAFHLYPEQTVLAFQDLQGKKLVSSHWGMFSLSDHSWFDPIEIVSRISASEKIEHLTPMIGETVNGLEDNMTKKWWQSLIH